jgi:hypothetical protein
MIGGYFTKVNKFRQIKNGRFEYISPSFPNEVFEQFLTTMKNRGNTSFL